MSGGVIPSAKDLTMDSFVKIITDNTKCASDNEYYYEAKTGRTIGHTVYKEEYHDADGRCEEMSIYDYMESIK